MSDSCKKCTYMPKSNVYAELFAKSEVVVKGICKPCYGNMTKEVDISMGILEGCDL